METAKPRGGNGISRYKINPLFFVRAKSVRTDYISQVVGSAIADRNAAARELAGLAME